MNKKNKSIRNFPNLRFPEFSEEWEEINFKEIFNFSTGKNIKQKEASPNYEIPCVRYGELYHMYGEVITKIINKTNLKKEELKFSNGNEIILPSAGEDPLDIGSASALTIKNVAIGRTINILSPLKQNVYSQIFVSFYINQILKTKIAKLSKGVSISNVYNSDLKRLKLKLPILKEQIKIANFLTKLDDRISTQRELIEELEKQIKGYQQKLFVQEIRFKDSNGNDFEDWKIKKLDNIGKVFNGLTGKTKENFGNGKPYIQYKQIFDSSKIDISNCGLVEIEQNENQTKMLYGDIFFTTSSETPNEIAFSSVLLNEMEEVYLNSFCFCFRPNQQLLNSTFAQFLFRSNHFRKKVIPLAQGSTRYNISKKEFLKIKIKCPCIKEQQKNADFLSKLSEKLETEQKLLSAYEQQKKYFLQNMFV